MATKPFNWGIWTSPVVLPAASLAATSPNSIASGRNAAARPESKRSPRPIANPSGSFASSAVAAEELQVGQELKVDIFSQVAAVDVIGHEQGPRHRRRDETARFQGPAGHARREEGPSPSRLDRLQHHPAPRLQGPADGRPLWRDARARSAISRWSASTWTTTCCWSAGRAGAERRLRDDPANQQACRCRLED